MLKLVGKSVGSTGYGLMGLTWRDNPCPQSQAFAAMKAALASGANFWNGGEIYGPPNRNSLHLLNEYFTQYPDDAEKVVISIKGGTKPGEMVPDGSPQGIRRSVDECLRVLDGKKFLDIFECARVDSRTPIEDTVGTLAEYVKEGKLGGISLSECSAKTIRRAAAVHRIEAVEVEFSMFETEILNNGVAEACAEFKIPIVAYSPLGRGILTGKVHTRDDISNPRIAAMFPRFQSGAFEENIKLVHAVQKIANKKGATVGQIALAWVKAHSSRKDLPVIIPIPGATTEDRVRENMKDVQLDESDMAELEGLLKNFVIHGERYPPGYLMELAKGDTPEKL